MRDLLSSLSDAARWEPGPLPGSSLFHLDGGPRIATADAGFVRLPAGLEFPVHRHLGSERVLLLEGSYRDSDGKHWGPGRCARNARRQLPRVHGGQRTRSLLIATVLEAGIEIAGMGVVNAKKP